MRQQVSVKNAGDDANEVNSDDLDPIERLFNFFFGPREAEPAGLKRFGRGKFPEQYPCVKDVWASLLSSDSKNRFTKFRPMLASTNMEFREMRVVYDAAKDGWSASQFHTSVDRKGAALMVCETSEGQLIGGYNPKGWVGLGEYRSSLAAFLFSFEDGDQQDRPTKLSKVGGKGLSVVDEPENGPMFGMDSIVVDLPTRSLYSKLGNYYEKLPSGRNSIIRNGRASSKIRNCRVFCGVYEPGEEIPFSDAEPFALY